LSYRNEGTVIRTTYALDEDTVPRLDELQASMKLTSSKADNWVREVRAMRGEDTEHRLGSRTRR
jgi:hypothetical protein